MKKINFILALTVAAFVVAPFSTLTAKNKPAKEVKSAQAKQIELSHFSSDDNFVYLKVSFNQLSDKAATMRISDGFGELLYIDRFNSKSVQRILRFNAEELADEANFLTVEFTTAEGTIRKKFSFGVKTFTTPVIEEVSSTK